MTDSNYSNYRPEVDLAADKIDEYLKELEERNAQQQAVEQEATEKEDQALAQQEDPRNSETWGAKAFIKEGQSILSGGLQDTASSIATFPERTADALSGEMQRQREETGTYKPDWTPFDAYDNPIETKTWWGKQLRGLVHFGTLALGTVAAAKAAAATGVVSIPAGLLALSKGCLLYTSPSPRD